MTPTRFNLLVFAILLAAVFRGEGVAKYGAGEVGSAVGDKAETCNPLPWKLPLDETSMKGAELYEAARGPVPVGGFIVLNGHAGDCQ